MINAIPSLSRLQNRTRSWSSNVALVLCSMQSVLRLGQVRNTISHEQKCMQPCCQLSGLAWPCCYTAVGSQQELSPCQRWCWHTAWTIAPLRNRRAILPSSFRQGLKVINWRGKVYRLWYLPPPCCTVDAVASIDCLQRPSATLVRIHCFTVGVVAALPSASP